MRFHLTSVSLVSLVSSIDNTHESAEPSCGGPPEVCGVVGGPRLTQSISRVAYCLQCLSWPKNLVCQTGGQARVGQCAANLTQFRADTPPAPTGPDRPERRRRPLTPLAHSSRMNSLIFLTLSLPRFVMRQPHRHSVAANCRPDELQQESRGSSTIGRTTSINR
jgi:hypothetical protein